MGKFYYLENNWPIYVSNEMPIIGWIPIKDSPVRILYKYDQIYDMLIDSGMTPEEVYHFFEFEDQRHCVEDKGF